MIEKTLSLKKEYEKGREVKLKAQCINSGKYVNLLDLPNMKHESKRHAIRMIHNKGKPPGEIIIPNTSED